MSHHDNEKNRRGFQPTLRNPARRIAAPAQDGGGDGRIGRPESGRGPDDAGHRDDEASILCRLAPPGVAEARYVILCAHGSEQAMFVAPDDARAIVMARSWGARQLVCEHSFGEVAKSAGVRLERIGPGPVLEMLSLLCLTESLFPFVRADEPEPPDMFRFAMATMFFASNVLWRMPGVRERDLFAVTIRASGQEPRPLALLVLTESSPYGPGITLMDHDVRIHTVRRDDVTISGRTRLTVTFRRGPRWLQDLASRGWSAEALPVPISREEEGELNLRCADVKVLTAAFECLDELANGKASAVAEVDGVTVEMTGHRDAALLLPDSRLAKA